MPKSCEVIDDLLTEQEVAQLFGRGTLTVSLWRKHSKLPHVRIVGQKRDAIRYRLAQILAWGREHDKTPDRKILVAMARARGIKIKE